jgi:PAS domain-containing protein
MNAELKLNTERKFLEVLQSDNNVVFVFNREGRYIDVSTKCPHLLYRPVEDILNRTVHEIFPDELADLAVETINSSLDEGRCIEARYRLDIDDESYWFQAISIPFSEEEVIWIAKDVTQIVEEEQIVMDAVSVIDNIF